MERTGFSPAFSIASSDQTIPSSSSSSANPQAPEAKRTRLGGPTVRAMVTRLETGSPRNDGSNHGARETIAVSDGDDNVSVRSSVVPDSDDDLEEERRVMEKEVLAAQRRTEQADA